MAIEKSVASSSLAEVIDRVLDKGVVIDAFVRVALVGIELIAIEARVVIALGRDLAEICGSRWPDRAAADGLTVSRRMTRAGREASDRPAPSPRRDAAEEARRTASASSGGQRIPSRACDADVDAPGSTGV